MSSGYFVFQLLAYLEVLTVVMLTLLCITILNLSIRCALDGISMLKTVVEDGPSVGSDGLGRNSFTGKPVGCIEQPTLQMSIVIRL